LQFQKIFFISPLVFLIHLDKKLITNIGGKLFLALVATPTQLISINIQLFDGQDFI